MEEAARVGVEVVVTVRVAKAAARVGVGVVVVVPVVATAAIGTGQPRVVRQGTALRAFCCYIPVGLLLLLYGFHRIGEALMLLL